MRKLRILLLVVVVMLLVTACQPTGDPILTIGDEGYTRADLEEFGVISVDYTGKDGDTTTYDGVALVALLEDAGITESGKTLVFTAADGYQAEIITDEALACDGCAIAFDEDTLRSVMPDFSGKLQVKELIEISIK